MSDFVRTWSRFGTEYDTELRAALETLHKKLNEIEDGKRLDVDVKPEDAKPPDKNPSEGERLILI
jgi:hypothetical protein